MGPDEPSGSSNYLILLDVALIVVWYIVLLHSDEGLTLETSVFESFTVLIEISGSNHAVCNHDVFFC